MQDLNEALKIKLIEEIVDFVQFNKLESDYTEIVWGIDPMLKKKWMRFFDVEIVGVDVKGRHNEFSYLVFSNLCVDIENTHFKLRITSIADNGEWVDDDYHGFDLLKRFMIKNELDWERFIGEIREQSSEMLKVMMLME